VKKRKHDGDLALKLSEQEQRAVALERRLADVEAKLIVDRELAAQKDLQIRIAQGYRFFIRRL
jgi:hypothetical protein